MVYNKRTENFEVNMIPVEMEGEMKRKETPKIRVEVDSIIDGPGYEEGPVDGVDQTVMGKVPADYYFLQDGNDGKYSITSNLYSPQCCSTQWPVPFHQKEDPFICGNKDEFSGSNYMGNTTFSNSGCACLTKNQAKFLYNRGGNGREFF